MIGYKWIIRFRDGVLQIGYLLKWHENNQIVKEPGIK